MTSASPGPRFEHPRSQSDQYNNNRRNHGSSQHWSTYSFVQLYIRNLPIGVSTLDIFNNFTHYGSVSKIIIHDRRQGDWTTRADLYFEPPPKYPIWEGDRVPFIAKNGSTTYVYLTLSDHQPQSFQVESPVQRGIFYNEKTEVFATSLTWGVLTESETMTTMASTSASENDKIRLVLNLRRREIEVFFPFLFHSEIRTAVRNFRFVIALDENFAVWRHSDNGYIFHLSSIPWYSKQLKEAVANSHSQDAGRWSLEDTWARQTDIFDHKRNFDLINNSPISLHKNLNSINIARWTTFKIELSDTPENTNARRVLRTGLEDFNVKIYDGSDFKFIQGGPELDLKAWNIIDNHGNSKQPVSLAEDLLQYRLPFSVRYQLEVCLSQGWLSEYQITPEFLQTLGRIEESQARQMLVYVESYRERIWDPMVIFDALQYRRPVKKRPVPEQCMEVNSATVTATSIIWNTPTVELTNRVIRKHKNRADHFIRVKFEDDVYRGQSRIFASSNNKMVLIFQRVKRVLLQGIRLGDRHYEFLAWGNSQLREHGAYFFARTESLTAADLRLEMGAFDQEKVVAKRAARMGQCFSTTKQVHLRLPPITSTSTIKDIQKGKYTFTDGVGKISPLAAQLIHQQLKLKGQVPSVFQFRLGGCKGVLAVWPDLSGIDVQVRASQFKFNSTSGDLEIIRCSEFWQPFLNRQVIICLSNLGVPDEVFLRKQGETIKALDAAMKNDSAAVKSLRDNVDPNMITLSMVNLVEAGFRASQEPFVTSILHLWKAWSLKYLKEKAKIPVSKGAFVLGCVDETNSLQGHFDKVESKLDTKAERIKNLAEIFIQITNPHTGQREVVEGICILARNPSLHRGDIRVVKAADKPALRHLCDVVVMPANGDRDLASMCSGGDLDGDDYMVIWDPDLIPEVWNAVPFHYDPPTPKTVDGEITTADIIEFFYDYLQNDYLGRIAHAHLAAADFCDDGIENPTCLELVKLHSTAVDYPKTGVPAIMERRLERTKWPHFMEKKGPGYKSRKVLGKLYDAVERIAFNPTHELPFDERILNAYSPTPETMDSVMHLKRDYDNALQRIMAQHNIRTEFEVWSTFVLDHSKASRDFKFHEEIGRLSSALKEQFYDSFCELAGGKDFENLAPVAIAAYQYTNAVLQQATKEVDQGLRYGGLDGMPFITFPWVLQDTLCKIARYADESIVAPGSFAQFKDGKLVSTNRIIEFDEKGRAQIAVQDPLDMEFSTRSMFSKHLPDPYRFPPVTDDSDLSGNHANVAVQPPKKEVKSQCEAETVKHNPESDQNSSVSNSELLSASTTIADTSIQNSIKSLSDDNPASPIYHTNDSISSCSSIELQGKEDETIIEENKSGGTSGTWEHSNQDPRNNNELSIDRGADIQDGQQRTSEHGSPETLKDPLDMTAEELAAMGISDDMEL